MEEEGPQGPDLNMAEWKNDGDYAWPVLTVEEDVSPFVAEQLRVRADLAGKGSRPEIVTLCGSTRFKQAFVEANFRLTMAGKIVLSVGWFSHYDRAKYEPTAEEKLALDTLHFRKIDLSDSIYVLNVDCYIGESTRNEIAYAKATGKAVAYLVS